MNKKTLSIVGTVVITIVLLVVITSVLSNFNLWEMAFSIFLILVFLVPVIIFFVFLVKGIKGRQAYVKKYQNDDKPNVIRPKNQVSPFKSFINITENRMVTCSTCGSKVDYSNVKCPRCSEPLRTICRCCGNENKVNGPACIECGKDLTIK